VRAQPAAARPPCRGFKPRQADKFFFFFLSLLHQFFFFNVLIFSKGLICPLAGQIGDGPVR
jgi:hypothetical protein